MSSFQFNGANYSSARAAGFAHAAGQRLAAEKRRHAGRQFAHDSAASARAAEKRAAKRHEIASRPRGKTEAIGHRADGSPIYRAIPAFRARPYTPPADRKERPERGALPIAGMRSHEETRGALIVAPGARVISGQELPWRGKVQRRIRKAANRRKARRGWR